MSITKYIEVNSTFRDRNLWPLPAEFEIPISQSGIKTLSNAIDPVSLSMPILSWSSNNLDLNGSNILGTLPPSVLSSLIIDNTEPIQYTSDGLTFVVLSKNQPLQQLKDYYDGLIICDYTTVPVLYRRIISSIYIGSYIVLANTFYRMQVTVFNTLPEQFNYGDKLYISDPTDFSDVNKPLVFVPSGTPQENAYNSYILYNETVNQYRPIVYYNNITNLIILDTTKSITSTFSSGPITVGVGNWQTTDNLSIRMQAPTIPTLGSLNYPLKVLSATSSIITVNDPLKLLSPYLDNYKNQFLRILPTTRYNYNPIPTNNEARSIISYKYNSITNIATFVTYPGFSIVPLVNSPVEIIPYSYDNFNPFVYTGSLVSQQNMVCYQIQLISLILPNYTLAVDQGGRIAFYPYVYVQLSNVSATGAGLKNVIYSNDPNATNVVFRAPIYDVNNPLNTPFTRINGGSMVQTIKFKPNDNLYFKVSLSNGETYNTILPELFSPSIPNPLSQISAIFSIKRIPE